MAPPLWTDRKTGGSQAKRTPPPQLPAVCEGSLIVRKSHKKTSSAAPARDAPPARARSHHHRAAHHTLLFGLAKNKRAMWSVAASACAAVAAIALVFAFTDLSWAGVNEWIDQVNPWAALPLMAFLPVVGFPISIVYLFAGARFGPIWGGVVVAGVTGVHLVLTYAIARSFLRVPLQRWIEKKHQHLPEIPVDEQAAVCVIAALVPGLPYVIRNYLLALAGVRLRYYLGACLPIYLARSYVTILLGDLGSDPHRGKIILLLAIDSLKVAICAYVIWRLREHHRKYHGHEDGQGAGEPAADGWPPANAAAK